MKKLLICAVVLFAQNAFAQQDYPRDITLSWTNPSLYVDGTSIDPGDLDSIRVTCFRGSDTTPAFTSTVPDTGEGAQQTESQSQRFHDGQAESFLGTCPECGAGHLAYEEGCMKCHVCGYSECG